MSGKKRLSWEKRWTIGADCETRLDITMLSDRLALCGDAIDHDPHDGGKWQVDGRLKRPKGDRGQSVRDEIIARVAKLHKETPRMVTSCWVEYRRVVRLLKKSHKLPDPTLKPRRQIKPNPNYDPWGPDWQKSPIGYFIGQHSLLRGMIYGPGELDDNWRENRNFRLEKSTYREYPAPWEGRPAPRWGWRQKKKEPRRRKSRPT